MSQRGPGAGSANIFSRQLNAEDLRSRPGEVMGPNPRELGPAGRGGNNMPTKADAASAQIQHKAAVIEEIKERLESADAAMLTEYRGLTVSDIADLRAALRPAATDYKIFKNTLARRAASEAGLGE